MKDIVDVGSYGGKRDVKPIDDFLVGKPLSDQPDDFRLSVCYSIGGDKRIARGLIVGNGVGSGDVSDGAVQESGSHTGAAVLPRTKSRSRPGNRNEA